MGGEVALELVESSESVVGVGRVDGDAASGDPRVRSDVR